MRYFCVGFKSWVEVRASKIPLKKKETSVTRSTMTTKPRYWDGPFKPESMKYTMKSIVYVGGKVVTVVPDVDYRKITGLHAPSHGKVVEIRGKDMIEELKTVGRKYN